MSPNAMRYRPQVIWRFSMRSGRLRDKARPRCACWSRILPKKPRQGPKRHPFHPISEGKMMNIV